MDINLVHETAKNLMINNRIRISRESGYSFYHGTRVANLAITIRKHVFPDVNEYDEIIKAAGYFHDIAKGIEPHKKYGAVLAKEALKDMCSAYELNMICEIIQNHQNPVPNNDHFTSKLIQDADKIDWTGANGVWIDLYYRANADIPSIEYIKSYEENDLDDNGEKTSFNFDISKNIFADRMKYKNDFIRRLKKEALGEIYLPERFGL